MGTIQASEGEVFVKGMGLGAASTSSIDQIGCVASDGNHCCFDLWLVDHHLADAWREFNYPCSHSLSVPRHQATFSPPHRHGELGHPMVAIASY